MERAKRLHRMKRGIVRTGLGACLCALAACQLVGGSGETGLVEVDAGDGVSADAKVEVPQEYAVRGVATGVLAPLSLELMYTGGSELLSITADGSFAFETPLEDRHSYAISFVGQPPCTLENGNGIISGADAEVVLACEGAPFLTDIALSGLTAPDLSVSLAQEEYTADVSLLQQSVSITPVALNTDLTITVAGEPVASGAASASLPLALGDNEIEVVVAHPSGLQRTYRVTVRRAAALAQYTYGKASNTGADDHFGISVALSGDTLAVSASGEDSAATGVGGSQTDDSALESGAVYVFRRSGTTWAQEAYLKPSNTGADDRFGHSVVLSGDTLAVGAYREGSGATGVGGSQTDDSAEDSGAVYIFH